MSSKKKSEGKPRTSDHTKNSPIKERKRGESHEKYLERVLSI